MDASSELIHSLLPVFMVSTLGAGALAVGLVEGVAEATAPVVKVFSGALSDRLGRRKGLVLLGYGLAAATKPFFAAARSVEAVLGARFVDRVGKGVRGAPRDALIAELAPPEALGAAYGLRQALDTVGAFLGPLLGIVLMVALHDSFRTVFWIACAPAALAALLVAVGVREPRRAPAAAPAPSARPAIQWASLGRFPRAYWGVLALGAVFSLGRLSEAFLILRAKSVGLPDAYAPAVFIAMNAVYAAAAYPAGRLADRLDRRKLLAAGLVALLAADAALAAARGLPVVALGVALWGLHMALTQGLFSAMVAAAAPADLRGTGFGLFNLAGAGALLVASAAAGLVWQRVGPGAAFALGAAPAAAALLLLALGA